jgi:hypothetical protein
MLGGKNQLSGGGHIPRNYCTSSIELEYLGEVASYSTSALGEEPVQRRKKSTLRRRTHPPELL